MLCGANFLSCVVKLSFLVLQKSFVPRVAEKIFLAFCVARWTVCVARTCDNARSSNFWSSRMTDDDSNDLSP